MGTKKKKRTPSATPPGNPAYQKAVQAYQQGDLATARALCLAMQGAASAGRAAFLLGLILQAEGKEQEAIASLETAIVAEPKNGEYLYNLARILHIARQLDQARRYYQQSLLYAPNNADTLDNLGVLYQQQGDFPNAITQHTKALELAPSHPNARFNLAKAYHQNGEIKEAIKQFLAGLRLSPNHPNELKTLGILYLADNQTENAIRCFKNVLRLAPKDAGAHYRMGTALRELLHFPEAFAYFQTALTLCTADDKPLISATLFSTNYMPGLPPDKVFDLHRTQAPRLRLPTPQPDFSHGTRNCEPERRLRIGYVSPDFRYHSVAYFFESVITRHDHQLFEITCYSCNKNTDEMTARLREQADHWRELWELDDTEAAATIYKDRIDILVDLSGHTGDNRLPIFTLKPAPIQATYLGYPNTTGLTEIDYRLTDAIADPPGWTEQWYTEKLLRLPRCFLCYTPPAEISPPVAPLPVESAGHITFASFNNLNKMNEGVIRLWAIILTALPNSQLVLKSKHLSDKAKSDRILQLFAHNSIPPERLLLVPRVDSRTEHLELYGAVDIALDPFPYSGTTTTCEALWMGVPVITLAGEIHASRVGASLLTAIGLEELIAHSEEEYVQKAVALATDLQRLNTLRATMRERMRQSPLMDAQSFTRNLESAYRKMWRDWCARQQPIFPDKP